MKVVIQIPCLNEEQTLPLVFEKMPKEIPGVDELEFLVIDDGCTDGTVEVARRLGVRHFVHHTRNMGLGQSFQDGALKALEMGADILVNTDGDNQYPSERIPDLVAPILHRMADIVVADRQTHKIEHFSPVKKKLQKVGSRVVNRAAGTRRLAKSAWSCRAAPNWWLRCDDVSSNQPTSGVTVIKPRGLKMMPSTPPTESDPRGFRPGVGARRSNVNRMPSRLMVAASSETGSQSAVAPKTTA